MTAIAWAFLAGWFISLAAGAALAYALHRRIVRYQTRTLESERLAELGLLTSGLAHELRNPLSTVQLNLQLLDEDLQTFPARHRVGPRVQTLQREVARLRDTLDDFLRYGGRMELDRQPLDIRNLLQDLADFVLPQAQLARVQLRSADLTTPLPVQGDERLLKQAILNLMINALQAMTDGGELILKAARAGKQVTVDVIDTGPGIAPEHLPNIFRAYYSTKKGGTGLGLPMTRRIIEAHDGTIAVHSEIGKGTRFTLSLPAGE